MYRWPPDDISCRPDSIAIIECSVDMASPAMDCLAATALQVLPLRDNSFATHDPRPGGASHRSNDCTWADPFGARPVLDASRPAKQEHQIVHKTAEGALSVRITSTSRRRSSVEICRLARRAKLRRTASCLNGAGRGSR